MLGLQMLLLVVPQKEVAELRVFHVFDSYWSSTCFSTGFRWACPLFSLHGPRLKSVMTGEVIMITTLLLVWLHKAIRQLWVLFKNGNVSVWVCLAALNQVDWGCECGSLEHGPHDWWADLWPQCVGRHCKILLPIDRLLMHSSLN